MFNTKLWHNKIVTDIMWWDVLDVRPNPSKSINNQILCKISENTFNKYNINNHKRHHSYKDGLWIYVDVKDNLKPGMVRILQTCNQRNTLTDYIYDSTWLPGLLVLPDKFPQNDKLSSEINNIIKNLENFKHNQDINDLDYVITELFFLKQSLTSTL